MIKDYYDTLIKDIIENNDKEKAIKIIANKLNEKQTSNEKEILTNLEKDKEIERLNNIINKVIADIEDVRDKNNYYDDYKIDSSILTYWLEVLKGSDK